MFLPWNCRETSLNGQPVRSIRIKVMIMKWTCCRTIKSRTFLADLLNFLWSKTNVFKRKRLQINQMYFFLTIRTMNISARNPSTVLLCVFVHNFSFRLCYIAKVPELACEECIDITKKWQNITFWSENNLAVAANVFTFGRLHIRTNSAWSNRVKTNKINPVVFSQ